MVKEQRHDVMSEELEARFGERIDKAVWKVSGLLPVEWSVELANVMRALVTEAAGWSQDGPQPNDSRDDAIGS